MNTAAISGQRVAGDHCQLQHEASRAGAGADDLAPARRPRASTSSTKRGRPPAGRQLARRASSVASPELVVHRHGASSVERSGRAEVRRRASYSVHTLIVGEAVEHVELGERDLGQRVEAHRVAQHHAVEPAGASAPAGDGAELVTDVDQPRRRRRRAARWGTDRRRRGCVYALVIPTMRSMSARPEAGADAGAAGGRVRRGDERIGAVVEVEERRLRALQQQVVAGVERVVQQVTVSVTYGAQATRRVRRSVATISSTSSGSPPSATIIVVLGYWRVAVNCSRNAPGSSTSPARRPTRRALSA